VQTIHIDDEQALLFIVDFVSYLSQ